MKPLIQIKFIIYFSLFFILINCNQFPEKLKPIFRCNADSIKSTPIIINTTLPMESKNSNYKRTLDNIDKDGFKDFNIYLDLLNFEDEIIKYNLTDKRELFINGMNKAIKTIKTLLKVKIPDKNYQITDEQINQIQIYNWNKSMIGDKAYGLKYLGIDLVIFVRFGDNEELGNLTLATAGVQYLANNYQPLVGLVNINKDSNYSKYNSLNYFEMTVMHEFTHILGFSNYYFYVFNIYYFEVDDYGVSKAYINSTKVINVAKNYFNCNTIKGIQLEEYGGNGTFGSHWEERILLGEYMGGVIYEEEEVISEFTLALLEDLGFYKANYYTGGLMQFGKNKGCDFLNLKCLNNGKVNPKFKNEFFDNIYNLNYDPSCSSGRLSRAYHLFRIYESIPKQYQYFSNKQTGGRYSTDYCPVSQYDYHIEGNNIYYVGHCSEIGSGEYGSRIPYRDKENNIIYYKSANLTSITGEQNSENSFCVLSSLVSNNIQNYELYSNTIRAICYKMSCSNRSLTIQIHNNFIVCPREGGKIKIDNYEGYLLCPDYYLICSGTVLCNNMFDCVEKKSLLKKDIIYDYITKTSQDIKDSKNESFSEEAYELSTDGICPQYCVQCNELSHCIKCKNDYEIVALKENEIINKICMLESELTIGYYKNDGIYYKCPDDCEDCINESQCKACKSGYINKNYNCFAEVKDCNNYDNNGNCIKCQEEYRISENGKTCLSYSYKCVDFNSDEKICNKCEDNYTLYNYLCYKEIENCEKYEEGKYCQKCKEGFAFEETDNSICKNISLFEEEYYSKDEGIIYFKCDGEDNINIERIKNCKQCEYKNDSKLLVCIQCENDFILKDDENNKCYDNQTFINNKKYYYEDSFHIKTCSKAINNCDECEKIEDNVICEKCNENYSVVINENITCNKKDEIIPFDEYYFNEDNNTYYYCGNKNYHKVENCKKCDNNTSCNLCKDNYTFIDDDKQICKNKDELGNKYIIDENDETIYRECSYYIENCETCSSKDMCLSCNNQYGLYNNKSKCINLTENYYYKNTTDDFYYLCSNNIDNCEKCLNESECISCLSDYIKINNLCYKSIEKCENYSDFGICEKCENGYNITNEGNNCTIGIENCKEVNKEGDCITCESDYRLSKFNCYKIIENCYNYSEDELCEKCMEGYAFENNNKTICKNISLFEEYYSKDNGINYIKCNDMDNEGIENCRKCEYTNNILICKECNNNFILRDDENNKCYDNQTFINNKTFYYEDSFHIKACSKAINNCDECEKIEDNVICEKCNENYSVVINENITCNKKDEIIPFDEYYFNEDNNTYYYCGNKNYHKVENCKKCDNNTSCNLCKDNYTFIDDDKQICKNKDELGNKYIIDENDETIYRECSYYIENCETCSSKDMCLSCNNQYGLYNNKSKCINTNNDIYYKNMQDNLYYLCNSSILNCETCSAYNNCIKCTKEYIKINNDASICHPINEINIKEYYINPRDNNMYLKCSSFIQNCYSCEYPNRCNLCQSGYIFINDNFKNCIDKSKFNLSYYFTEDNKTYYSCDDYKYKSNIQCFGIIPHQNINITFLQAQLIDYQLFIYMLTHSPLPKNFSLIITINIYTSERIRNLQNSEKEVILTTNDDSDGSKNKIISFTSNERYNNEDGNKGEKNIQIKDIQFDNNNNITKKLTDNNVCSLNFDKNSDLVDTGKVKSMIKENKITDLSVLEEKDIINLSLGNIDGCQINLNSDGDISGVLLNLELVEYDNNNNKISAECDIKEDNNTIINCKIKNNVNNYFSFQDKIISTSNKYIIISYENENKFQISCNSKNENSKIYMIMVCVIIVALVFLLAIIIYIFFRCNKNNGENNEKEKKLYIKEIMKVETDRKKLT